MPSSPDLAGSSELARAQNGASSSADAPRGSSGSKHSSPAPKDEPEVIVVEDHGPISRQAAQSRHEADLVKHAYTPPRPERVQDDWQVAYVWAFIVKFGLLPWISSLLSLEDFERSLCEPVANRPDDVLEGVLIAFIKNLKPGLRNVDCTNVQSHVSNYISDMLLNSSEFTVWDRAWAPSEEARGDCCNKTPTRLELGRLRGPGEDKSARVKKNPLVQIERRGGGLFELDWYERARLLRQLVDWQLSHSDVIREKIKDAQAKKDEANKKKPKRKNPEPEVEEVVDKSAEIWIEPIGLDRNRNRIWSIDKSARLYRSGNPFKRPCSFVTMTTTRAELQTQMEEFQKYGESKLSKPAGSGPKGKTTKKQDVEHRRAVKGVQDEKELGKWVEGFLPDVEKEEARVSRARKRVFDTMRILQQAELRTTRTRRSTKKIDYTYDSLEEEDDAPRRGGRRGAAAVLEPPRRPVIPGERRSGRLQAKEEDEYEDVASEPTASRQASRDISPAPPSPPRPAEVFPQGTTKVKGYAWIEEPGPSAVQANANGVAANGGGAGTADEPMEIDL